MSINVSRMRETTIKKRQIVINNYKNNKAVREIVAFENRKKRNGVSACKLSDRDKRNCLKQIENNPLLSAVDIKII